MAGRDRTASPSQEGGMTTLPPGRDGLTSSTFRVELHEHRLDEGLDGARLEASQILVGSANRSPDGRHRRPDGGVGRAVEAERRNAEGGREVKRAGVVSDVEREAAHETGDLPERKAAHAGDSGPGRKAHRVEERLLLRTGEEKDADSFPVEQTARDLSEIGGGPAVRGLPGPRVDPHEEIAVPPAERREEKAPRLDLLARGD